MLGDAAASLFLFKHSVRVGVNYKKSKNEYNFIGDFIINSFSSQFRNFL